MSEDYKNVNRRAWAYLARHGSDSSRPFGAYQFGHAREILDGRGWIPWNKIARVLCLACGGGQQSPLFAHLGYQVTTVDLSAEQLRLDYEVARRHGLELECVEADMMDLSPLYGHQFDLVYQAISACYVPDVRGLYREVFRVLKPGGFYWVEHWNPVHVQLAEDNIWDGEAYRISRPQQSGAPVPWTAWTEDGAECVNTCWHYVHPLGHLIGGLCETGFTIVRFAETRAGDLSAEAGSHAHLAAYLPPFFAIFARRRFR